MEGLRPRQVKLRLIFRLFKFYARQASHKTNNLKTNLKFPCLGLNPTIHVLLQLYVKQCWNNIVSQ